MAAAAMERSEPVAFNTTTSRMRQADRRAQVRALLLVAPLGLFILLTFAWPLVDMLSRSVDNQGFGAVFHRTAVALRDWDGRTAPGDAAFDALAADLAVAKADQTLGTMSTLLNQRLTGGRSLMMKAARAAAGAEGNAKAALIGSDAAWGEPAIWATIQRLTGRITAENYLGALDLDFAPDGSIAARPVEQRVYLTLLLRTFGLSALITALCLLLGFPVAYVLSILPLRTSNLLMILVLLPFWTSLLVRTTAWIVLLQTSGVINDTLVWAHIVDEQGRLALIFNATGTVIAMTHILLPFMILPLYSVMNGISPAYVRAAISLGASPATAFRRVYVPQTVAGIAAGSLLVFILAIGYYITPALVGGQSGQFISNMIAYHMQQSLNWGLAAALGTILLVCVLLTYWLYNRLLGAGSLRMG